MQASTSNTIKNEAANTKNMRLVPSGKFQMGSKGWGQFESPIHQVFIDDFLMDDTPVTNEQFAEFIKQTGYQTTAEIKGSAWGYHNGKIQEIEHLYWESYFTEKREKHPVVLVSWHDANAFAKWADKRLPTEAEWEKAARATLENNLYPWGNNEPDNTICNFGKETKDCPATTEVKSFLPNAFGLYDMVGNVWNWCSDWFSEAYYSEENYINPIGPITGTTKIRRGASYNIIQPFRLRCANRGAYNPDNYAINIGFRCVKDFK